MLAVFIGLGVRMAQQTQTPEASVTPVSGGPVTDAMKADSPLAFWSLDGTADGFLDQAGSADLNAQAPAAVVAAGAPFEESATATSVSANLSAGVQMDPSASSQAMTVELWTAGSADATLFTIDGLSVLRAEDRIRVEAADGAVWETGPALSTTDWNQVVLVAQGGPPWKADDLGVFVDGEHVALEQSRAGGTASSPPADFSLGGDGQEVRLKDVAVYDKALNDQQIADHYHALPVTQGWQLVAGDEFAGDAVDQSLWTIYDPGNGLGRYGSADPDSLHCLTSSNVAVDGGSVTIAARPETRQCGEGESAYTSGFLGSRESGKYYPLYGRFEFRARVPHGQGVWPALWLRHVDGSSSAEVDVAEVFHSTDPGAMRQSLHFPNSVGYNAASEATPFETPVPGVGDWHTYAVEITPEGSDDEQVRFAFSIDGRTTLEYVNPDASSWTGVEDQTSVWDIAINVAVGGQHVGNPDENLGWLSAQGGQCSLERPQRKTSDAASCSLERTPGAEYNAVLTSAPEPDGQDDIWLAPWNYGTEALMSVDYVRFYERP